MCILITLNKTKPFGLIKLLTKWFGNIFWFGLDRIEFGWVGSVWFGSVFFAHPIIGPFLRYIMF